MHHRSPARRVLPLLAAALVLGALCGTARANVLPPLPPLSPIPQLGWEANGPVNAVASRGDVAFVGGGFTHLGPPATGRSAVVAAASGVPRYGLPRVDGEVLAAAGDGAGGWFIGGRFQKVGGVTCPRLAHVRADLTVDPGFCPRPGQLPPGTESPSLNNGPAEVRVLLRSGDVLYVGGTFRAFGIDTQNLASRRAHLAALSTANGQLLPWNPGPIRRDDGVIPTASGPASDGISAGVNTLALSGTSLYLGGAFASVNGTARKSLAAVSTENASVLPFDARAARVVDAPGAGTGVLEGPSHPVLALAVSGSFLFVGGDFGMVNGVLRSGLAKLDRTTGGLVEEWNTQALPLGAAANGRVRALRVRNFILYVGGEFDRVRRTGPPTGNSDPTASGPNLAAVLRTTGIVRPWVAGADGPVRALAFNGEDVVIGGAFRTVAGLARPGAAMTSPAAGGGSPGVVRAWSPRAGFSCASGSECLGVATLFPAGQDVYLGGGFDHVGGADRAGLAAIDINTGEATSWNAALDGGARRVESLAVRGTTVYAAGDFTSAGGQPRPGLAGLSTASAAPTTWQPAPLGVAPPPGLLSGPAGIYLLGRELGAGGTVPAVATDPATGAAGAWAPAVAGTAFIVPAERGIRAVAPFGDTLFLGGSFATIGGQQRPQLGSVSATTGAVTGWAPGGVAFGTVRAVAVRQLEPGLRLAYIGGDFTQAAGQSRRKLAAVDADSGALSPWAPEVTSPSGGSIASMLSVGADIVVGGTFGGINGADRQGLALLSPTAPAALREFDAKLDGPVGALDSAGTAAKLVAGGTFGRAGGRNMTGLAIFPRQPDVASSGARVSRTGSWRASVRCPRGTAGGCRLRARLRELATSRRRVIAVATARVPTGRVVRLRFPITRAGLALLGRRGRVPIRVEVVSRDRIGNRIPGGSGFVLTGGS